MPIFSGRIKRPKYSLALTHGAGANTVSATDTLNGILREAIIKTPVSVDGAATLTLNIIDVDSFTVYTKSAIAANTSSLNLLTNDLRVPLSGAYTIQIVFSANQTATDTTTAVVLVIES
jgi:hypothetical protein